MCLLKVTLVLLKNVYTAHVGGSTEKALASDHRDRLHGVISQLALASRNLPQRTKSSNKQTN